MPLKMTSINSDIESTRVESQGTKENESKKFTVDGLKRDIRKVRAGDRILLTGYVYTARDAAHKRFMEILDTKGKNHFPFAIENSIIYYAGPTPAPEGMPIGSCGPTTSGRMDAFAPRLLDLGLLGMIGKGVRGSGVREAIKRNGGIYLCALGGAGALACKCVRECDVIAFEDLGCESVKKIYIENFPLITGIDSFGGDIFNRGDTGYE